MAITVVSSGAQAATLDTEHTLNTGAGATGGAMYWLVVQVPSAATFADICVLRCKRECRTTDATEIVYEAVIRGAGSTKVFISPFLPVPDGFDYAFTLEQTDGTGRTWPWSVERS